MKYLIVIDMQEDFVNGVLGTPEAQAIVPYVVDKVKNYNGRVYFTRDTHDSNYLNTREGKQLPIIHCEHNTSGWQLVPELQQYVKSSGLNVYDKDTFGCFQLAENILFESSDDELNQIEEIEIVGVCTDICVISNALMLRSKFSEARIIVDACGCAGTSIENHNIAIQAMKNCHIQVINEP